MKLIWRLFTISVAIAVMPLVYGADTYNIDPAHCAVGFGVSHLVINTVRGKFNEFSGSVLVDGKTLQEAKGTIQTKSIDTGVAPRDRDLCGPNFFDVEKYPTITFQTKRSEQKGSETMLVGDFTL